MGRPGLIVGRRSFLRGIGLGAAGLVGLSFTDLMAVQAEELRKRQMACILLWMGGGPSQLDTWDPKPGTDNGGDTQAIASTSVPGIQLASHWIPRLSKVMKDVALIRSMTNKEGNHQRATYQLHTGYAPSGTVKHPGFGCVVAAELGDPKFDLPHIVSHRDQGQRPGAGGGTARRVKYEPFQVPDPLKPPLNVALPVPTGRFVRRLNLMHSLEVGGFGNGPAASTGSRNTTTSTSQTANMVLSPHMRAFDVDTEDRQDPGPLREHPVRPGVPAGPSPGRGRRDVRRGPLRGLGQPQQGHREHRQERRVGRPRLRLARGRPQVIAGCSTKTLVIWMGEFGRTPKINPNAGRDHFPRVFSVALAGGGVKGGQVIGSSTRPTAPGSRTGRSAVNRPDVQLLPVAQDRPQEGKHQPPGPADQDRRRRDDHQGAVLLNSTALPSGFARWALALAGLIIPGCGDPAVPESASPPPPLAIRPGVGEARTFEAGSEIPPASFAFEGASGHVRITLEAEQASSDGRSRASSLNDALFRATGAGRIVVSFRKPWPGHDQGRVTVRCEEPRENSSAEFEPSLWFGDPGAIVAFASPLAGSVGPITPGAEVVLARYAAKVGSTAVSLTIKATFAAEPPPVRVQATTQSR